MPITSIAGVSEDALSLKVLMDGVLERLVEQYDRYNTPLPAKRYWKVGAPVIDCEQLVLSVDSATVGLVANPLPQAYRGSAPRTTTFRAYVARQIPMPDAKGNEPSAAKQQEGSEILAVDMWVLLDAIRFLDAWDASAAFGMGVSCNVQFEEPQGGYQVITATYTMAIP